MEALTGVSIALLTIYDMCKAVDKRMEISGIRLLHKEGGKSGVFDADDYKDVDQRSKRTAGEAPAERTRR
jgi:hypothetical protein